MERDRRQHGERAAAAEVAPPAGAVFVAMVQGAVYGAVNAADRHGRPYLVNQRFPKASPDAAAATAAFRVLDSLFSATHHATLLAAYNDWLGRLRAGGENEGIAVGEMAAAAMLAEGHNSAIPIGCTFGTGGVGVWQPLPNALGMPMCDPTVWVANAKPFLLKSPSRFTNQGRTPSAAPNTRTTTTTRSVARQDRQRNTHRRPDARCRVLEYEPRRELQRSRAQVVDQFSLDVSDSARLFAMLDLSAADAIINTWNKQLFYNFWRPITAIRRVDDGNAATVPDPTWTPLFDPSLPVATTEIGERRSRRRTPITCLRNRVRECQHARVRVVLRHRRHGHALLPHEQPFPDRPGAAARTALFHAVLSCDERDPRSSDLGRNPLPQCGRAGGGTEQGVRGATSTSTSSQPPTDGLSVERPPGRSTRPVTNGRAQLESARALRSGLW